MFNLSFYLFLQMSTRHIFFILFCFNNCFAQIQTLTIDITGVDLSDSLIKPHMLGVIAGPAPNYNSIAPDLTTKYQDIGVTTIRNNDFHDDRLDMERMFFCGIYDSIPNQFTQYPDWDCDPDDTANYHFQESDIQFQNWLSGGFLPFFRLGGENSHPIHQHDYKGPRASEETNWIQAGLQVVNRYNNFNNQPNTLGGYLDLWTEYPQAQFWDRDSLEFNNFWCNAFDSLKTNFPSLKIGGPGFNDYVSVTLGNLGTVSVHIDLFLKELKNRNLRPDWLGFHIFRNNIDDYYNTAIAFRDLLEAQGAFAAYSSFWGGSGSASFFHNVELIYDAWGYDNDSSLPLSTRDSLFNKQRGAALVTGAFIALQQTDVERAYIYRGCDFGSDPNADSSSGYANMGVMGLFHGDSLGTYKPSAYAFKLCSQMQTNFNKKLESDPFYLASGGTKIWTLSGENINGEKATLLSNHSLDTVELSLQLNGSPLSITTYPYINQYTVSDSNIGQTPASWTSGTFTLLPYTANLITMTYSPSSTTEIKTENNIKVYPNPATNQIIISATNPISYEIFDLNGKIIRKEKTKYINSSSVTININDLSSGLYFLKVNFSSFYETEKIFINKY